MREDFLGNRCTPHRHLYAHTYIFMHAFVYMFAYIFEYNVLIYKLISTIC